MRTPPPATPTDSETQVDSNRGRGRLNTKEASDSENSAKALSQTILHLCAHLKKPTENNTIEISTPDTIMASRPGGAKQRLMTEMEALQKEKWVNMDLDATNIFRWRLALMVINPDSAFNGGYLRAEMLFTNEYPYQPPKFRFLIPIFHPNIYPDGQLCISILHKPGEDLMSGEEASERWSPLQGVESVLRSVLLLLDDPEINSPANVDAAVWYRDKRDQYLKKAQETVEKSKKDIPQGFEMPTTLVEAPPQKTEDDTAFWAESDEDFDFGGSDTGEDDDDEMADFEEEGEREEGSDDEES